VGLDTRDEFLSRILYAAARIKKSEDQLRQTHDVHTRVVLRLTVGFSNIYYEQLQICHLNIQSQLE
jgi:hypothetical protein